MKKGLVICILLVVLLVTGCSSHKAEVYKLKSIMGLDVAFFGESGDSMVITLMGNGKAKVIYDGEEAEGVTWKKSGNDITLNVDGEKLSGTVKDGVMKLNWDYYEVELIKQ